MDVTCGSGTVARAHSLAAATQSQLVHPAVVRLAESTATVRRLMADRWLLAAEALLCGATPDEVAAAAGLTLTELREALTRWASAQLHRGRLTEAQHVELVNIVFGPAG